jgi:hypothetical protein
VRRRWGSGKLPCGERRRAVSGAGSPVGSSAATPLVPPGRILVAADPDGSSEENLGGGEYGELRRRGARWRTPAKSFKSDLGGALIIFLKKCSDFLSGFFKNFFVFNFLSKKFSCDFLSTFFVKNF